MVYDIKSEDEFNTLIGAKRTTIVEFYANWCPPCHKIAPIVKEQANIYTDIQFLKVDVDLLDELTAKQDIQAMPTFMVYDSGETTGVRLLGADPDALIDLIRSVSRKETQSIVAFEKRYSTQIENRNKYSNDIESKRISGVKTNKCIIL